MNQRHMDCISLEIRMGFKMKGKQHLPKSFLGCAASKPLGNGFECLEEPQILGSVTPGLNQYPSSNDNQAPILQRHFLKTSRP